MSPAAGFAGLDYDEAMGRARALAPVLRESAGRAEGAREMAPETLYDRYPIQRLFRDQHALMAHIGFSWDAQAAPWGLVTLGGEFSSPTL